MNENFIELLQQEAQLQKKLNTTRIIPKIFDPITSFIGENSLLVLITLSVISAIIIEVTKWL